MQIKKENWIWRVDAVLIGYLFAVQMVITASGEWNGIFHVLYVICMVAELIFIFSRIFYAKFRNTAEKILMVYIVWLAVSRLICGDTSLSESSAYIMLSTLCICLFDYGAALDSEQRRRVLTVFSVGICAFYFVVGIVGIYAALTRSMVELPLDITVGIKAEGELRYLAIFGRHRNAAAQWFCLCACLAAYLFGVYKSRVFHITLATVITVCYIVVALSLSRVTMITLSVALAMTVMIYIDRKLLRKGNRARVLAAVLVAVLIVPLSYKGYGVVGSIAENLSAKIVLANKSEGDHSAGTTVDINGEKTQELKDNDVVFSETRDAGNVKELGGRNLVWRSTISLMLMEPERLLHGSLDNEYMTMVNVFISATNPAAIVANTHNFFLETLMLTGVPGLLLILAFIFILVCRMLRILLDTGVDSSIKLLTLTLTTVLLKNMGEAMLLRYDDITNYMFFLVAGVFLAYSYELLPEKKLHTRKA